LPVIETGPAGLVLGDQLRLECAMPVTRNFAWQFAELALQSLSASAISRVAGRILDRLTLAMAKVLAHLGLQRSLDQELGELF